MNMDYLENILAEIIRDENLTSVFQPIVNIRQQRIFGYHKSETRARLERLKAWAEVKLPATMAQIPVV